MYQDESYQSVNLVNTSALWYIGDRDFKLRTSLTLQLFIEYLEW
jgi:hypothetical protein